MQRGARHELGPPELHLDQEPSHMHEFPASLPRPWLGLGREPQSAWWPEKGGEGTLRQSRRALGQRPGPGAVGRLTLEAYSGAPEAFWGEEGPSGQAHWLAARRGWERILGNRD